MADVVSHERRQELARLLHERRWKPPELAQRFGCSVRTVQRDLEYFGDEMGEPVPMDDAGYYLNPGMHPVPSVSLTTHEARALLFAMRLFLRNADELDEDGLSLLGKLGAAFPGVMANYAHLTADELRQRPQNPLRAGILRRLTEAWISRRTVLLSYTSPGRRARTLTFDPRARPSGSARSTMTLCLPRLNAVQARLAPPGAWGAKARPGSPSGGSASTTSAPRSASVLPSIHVSGPGISSTRKPVSGPSAEPYESVTRGVCARGRKSERRERNPESPAGGQCRVSSGAWLTKCS